jgi:hypothetical protein
MARSSTSCCRLGVTWRPRGASSPRRCASARCPSRSRPTAPMYPRVLDELIPSALHTVERYANNPVEADHGRLKARLRPMRGLSAPLSADPRRRPRLRAESAPRPLRHRHRRPSRHRAPRHIRRSRDNHLTSKDINWSCSDLVRDGTTQQCRLEHTGPMRDRKLHGPPARSLASAELAAG